MIYREFLVMRKALLWYTGILAAAAIFMIGSIATGNTQLCGERTSLGAWAEGSGIAATIFAAIYGVGLGNASREGARVFWVLPQGRLRAGLGLLGVDMAGVVVAVALAFVGTCIVFGVGLPMQHSDCRVINDLGLQKLGIAIGFPLAVYGWCAVTGMLLRRVAYMGVVFLPVGLLWMLLYQQPHMLGRFLRSIAFANPFTINYAAASGVWQVWGIVIVTLAIALALWQRAEVVA
jgi:hypothetical protein